LDLISVAAALILAAIYSWTLYNLPSFLMGLASWLTLERRSRIVDSTGVVDRPSVTVIVPTKNEEKVIGRLLGALAKINYPQDRYEIIVVEDGSTDGTRRICEGIAGRSSGKVRFYHRLESNGKPGALNFALKHAKGEIVAVFDADSVPNPDAIANAVARFQDPSVVAVQGVTYSLNSRLNFLTRLVSYEDQAWQMVYIAGKNALKMFVPFTGNCLFLRRRILEQIGGWDEKSIAEDIELAARLLQHGHRISFDPSVEVHQESPSSVRTFFNQRTRWFRGYMETAAKYGVLLLRPVPRNIDAEITMAGSFMMTISLVGYTIGLYSLLDASKFSGGVFTLLGWSASCFTIVVLAGLSIATLTLQKPRRIRNLIWVPLIYCYWFLQAIIASRAFLQIVLRRQRTWLKTEKTGVTTSGDVHKLGQKEATP